jgi:RNA polymerase sigma-54 factor
MWVDEKDIEKVLLQVQQFDPAGIAARDLQECLLLQLRLKDQSNKNVQFLQLSDLHGAIEVGASFGTA